MSATEIRNHTIDVGKAVIGVFITSGLIAVLQYLGAHIPDLIQWLGSAGGGVAAIKGMRFRG